MAFTCKQQTSSSQQRGITITQGYNRTRKASIAVYSFTRGQLSDDFANIFKVIANRQRQLATHPSERRHHHAHQRLPLPSATHHPPKRRHHQKHQLLNQQKTRSLQKINKRSRQQIKTESNRLRQHTHHHHYHHHHPHYRHRLRDIPRTAATTRTATTGTATTGTATTGTATTGTATTGITSSITAATTTELAAGSSLLQTSSALSAA